METNVANFIAQNIMIFIPLGLIGIGLTLFLIFTAKKDKVEKNKEIELKHEISLFNKKFDINILAYLFIFFMMIIIGLLSEFYVPTLIGSIIAIMPVIILLTLKYKEGE